MSFALKLTEESIRITDPGAMGKAISEMGSHLRDAAKLADDALASASLPAQKEITSIVLAGLGGSAIGGDLVRSYLQSKLSVPFVVNRTYALPAFVGKNTLVIASSYSGDTEESLAMFDDARNRGAHIICISTGGKLSSLAAEHNLPLITLPKGFQPRAALGYSFVPVLLILQKLGFTSGESDAITSAANTLDELAMRYGITNSSDTNTALAIANRLHVKSPVIYSSSDVFDTVNIRWRGQIQENAKHVAFGNVLPEMNHNEINGWDFPRSMMGDFHVIFLRSPKDEHPRVEKRFAILKDVLHLKTVAHEEHDAEGDTKLARMFSLISLGDWTSYYMALLANVDPSPVPVISQLKKKLDE